MANFIFAQSSFKTGINFPLYIPNHRSIDQYLKFVNDCGGKAIRQMTWADVHWRHIESSDNNWDFTRSDSSFFNPFNLTPIGTLYSMMGNDSVGLQTPWLACNNPFNCYWDPAGDSIYSKDYIFHTINRYKNKTKYWEIANEIESVLPPAGLPNIYTKKEFLRYNYTWIKQTDPDAKILLPGLVGTCCNYPITNSFNWLRRMLEIGAGDYFDIMNYHDYNAWWTLPAHFDSVKNILKQFKLNKPIWITETSISSFNVSPITPSYSSEDEQAADVWRRICLLWAKGAEVVLWHSNWSSGDLKGWGEFGLVNNMGIKKKSFHSFKLLNNKVTNFTNIDIISLGDVSISNKSGGNGVWVIHFKVNESNKWVLWSPDNKPYTLENISSNLIEITEVVPNQLFQNGDSAFFVNKTFSVTNNKYSFLSLPNLPILIEEMIETSIKEKEIFFSPNPASDYIEINTSMSLLNTLSFPSNRETNIKIYNTFGECLIDLTPTPLLTGEGLRIDVSHLPAGVYLLQIREQTAMFIKM